MSKTTTTTQPTKIALASFKELGIDFKQYENRPIWNAEIEIDDTEYLVINVIAESDDVIQVFASIIRAKQEMHRDQVIDFIALYNGIGGTHTHLEYDFNYNTYRVAGDVMFNDDPKSLSVTMLVGMIKWCINSMGSVCGHLRAVEDGSQTPAGAIKALTMDAPADDAQESDSGAPVDLPQGMRLASVMQQWLKENDLNNSFEADDKKNKATSSFVVTIDEVELSCYIETYEDVQWCKCFLYLADPKVPVKRVEEVGKYVAEINGYPVIGCLQLSEVERTVRFYGSIDVEDAAFEPAHINNLLNAGRRKMAKCVPQLMAVYFGGKTAEEVLAEE
jgi:hypothetical protein